METPLARNVQVQDGQPVSDVELQRLLEEPEMPPKPVQERPDDGVLALRSRLDNWLLKNP